MDEYKVNGIVLSSSDYKEKDILINLFTAELGKIRAVLRGAKQSKAKLKFAGQPFCFAEWILIKKGEYFYVTNVNLFDTFYELTTDYDSFLIASSMSEICLEVLKPNMINEKLFLEFLNALKCLVYDKFDNKLVFSKFILNLFSCSGYGLNFTACGMCNTPIMGDIVLSSNTHEFCCVSCSNNFGLPVSKREYNTLKILFNATWSNLNTVKASDELLVSLIGLLKYNLQNILNHKFHSF